MSLSTASSGGRPRLSDLVRRTVQITPRFTTLEAARIEHDAALLGISRTEYVYRSALGAAMSVPAVRSVDPALITAINGLACQVRDLGNVTNQVAAYHHMDTPDRGPVSWHELPQNIKDNQTAVTELLEKLVGVDGS